MDIEENPRMERKGHIWVKDENATELPVLGLEDGG
jgi:hypothetical protein